MAKVPDLVKKYYSDCGKPDQTKIQKLALPQEIIDALGPIPYEGKSIEECIKRIETTFEYSMKTMHPFFNDKLYNGSHPVGHFAEYVTAVLNTNAHVYHVSPVFSVMEQQCVQFFGERFGFDPKTIDGSLNPGGSMSIIMSMLAAR